MDFAQRILKILEILLWPLLVSLLVVASSMPKLANAKAMGKQKALSNYIYVSVNTIQCAMNTFRLKMNTIQLKMNTIHSKVNTIQ